MSTIRVLIADDHTFVRSGLRVLLEGNGFSVIAEAADGRQAVDAAVSLNPDVAIIDVGMPRLNGIEATRQICASGSTTQVVILSMHSDEGYVLRALKAGARAYILKDSDASEVIRAIEAVSAGKAYFSPEISRVLAEDYVRQLKQKGIEDSYDLLTGREKEILQLLAEGNGNKDISTLLNLSPHTVETHRKRIMQKLNLHSLPDLVLYAIRKGVIR